MSLVRTMEKNSLVINDKGGKYYSSSYDANLDIFSSLSRFNSTEEITRKFQNALLENEVLALANLLYILDIRQGKGERTLFKTIYKYLCLQEPKLALKVLPFIGKLGRYDYILEGINTPIEDDVIKLIKETLARDMESEHPTLLAKWLPTHRSHNQNNPLAKKIYKKLGISEKEYRHILKTLRDKINIVESSLTNKDYNKIKFEEVPTKAMLKYQNVWNNKMIVQYNEYLKSVSKQERKINANNLYAYEIVRNILWDLPVDEKLYDLLWKNQKVIDTGDKNILVVADTSTSMTSYNYLPYATSVGLAIYFAEKNKGIFHDRFITFSSEPRLQKVIGKTIVDKVRNIESIVEDTDIDKVFELILDSANKEKLTQKDLPSHIIIVSDMEYTDSIMSKGGTNFTGWQKTYQNCGFSLPKIVFWNVSCYTKGVPVTKYDNDVVMIYGFSPNILNHLLDIDNFNPLNAMLEVLDKYIKMLEV